MAEPYRLFAVDLPPSAGRDTARFTLWLAYMPCNSAIDRYVLIQNGRVLLDTGHWTSHYDKSHMILHQSYDNHTFCKVRVA